LGLTDEEIARVNQHLRGKLRACPMCGNDKWQPLEVVAPPVYVRFVPGSAQAVFAKAMYPSMATSKTELVPLLLIACTNCFHVVPYAWQLIDGTGA
jgi:hypothetical protein